MSFGAPVLADAADQVAAAPETRMGTDNMKPKAQNAAALWRCGSLCHRDFRPQLQSSDNKPEQRERNASLHRAADKLRWPQPLDIAPTCAQPRCTQRDSMHPQSSSPTCPERCRKNGRTKSYAVREGSRAPRACNVGRTALLPSKLSHKLGHKRSATGFNPPHETKGHKRPQQCDQRVSSQTPLLTTFRGRVSPALLKKR